MEGIKGVWCVILCNWAKGCSDNRWNIISGPIWEGVSPWGLAFKYVNWVDFPGSSDGKESVLQCKRPRFDPWVGKISWRRAWQPTPVFLPGELHGQNSLVGCSPQGRKELDMIERLTLTCTFVNWVKEIIPTKRWASSSLLRAWIQQNDGGTANLHSRLELRAVFFGPQTSERLTLGIMDSN